MLEWFQQHAPIRRKFSVLLIVYSSIASIVAVVSALAYAGVVGPLPVLVVSALAVPAFMTVTLVARRSICDPYVTTVLRMEGLANGEIDTPIAFTNYRDCVGRMTKAMATFRRNAVEIRQTRERQELIVSALTRALRKLAANDIDCHIDDAFPEGYDGLRQDFNRAVGSLVAAISAAQRTAGSVLAGASEIRSASQDLAVRNEQQSADLEDTTTAMNHVTQSMGEAAHSARDVHTSIEGAECEARNGGEIVRQAVEAMAAIERSALEIRQIVSVIDAISFQTNLLALNAGVEAARAGESGKGFAVVATEVRALAQRSADAAKEIAALITTSSDHVTRGVRLVDETGSVLTGIVSRVTEISGLVSAMASSAQSQADGLSKVNGAMRGLDRVTQQNAAMVEQSTAAARSLAAEAEELAGIVNRFQIRDTGSAISSYGIAA